MVLVSSSTQHPLCRIRSWKNVFMAVTVPVCAIVVCVFLILLSRKYDVFGIHEDRNKCSKQLKLCQGDGDLHNTSANIVVRAAENLPRTCRVYKNSLDCFEQVYRKCPRLHDYEASENSSSTIRRILQGTVDHICKRELMSVHQNQARDFALCYNKDLSAACLKNDTGQPACGEIEEPYDCYIGWVRGHCTDGATEYYNLTQEIHLNASNCNVASSTNVCYHMQRTFVFILVCLSFLLFCSVAVFSL